MNVADPRYVNPLTRAFLAAAEEIGIAGNADFNGDVQDGAALYQVTQKNGSRWSAADGYLQPARQRSNLTVVSGAHAARVLMEGGRAVGVAFLRDGATEEARAEGEVILAGGTVNSPQLLMLSGIGPADELKAAGISPIHDLPGVGKNLQDHPMVSVGYLCTQKVSLDGAETLGNFLRWLVWKNGPLASNVAEAGLFLRTRAGLAGAGFAAAVWAGLLPRSWIGAAQGALLRVWADFDYAGKPRRDFVALGASAGCAGDSRELSFDRCGFAHDDRGSAAGAAAGACEVL